MPGNYRLIGLYIIILSRAWQQYLSDDRASVVVQSPPADLRDAWIPNEAVCLSQKRLSFTYFLTLLYATPLTFPTPYQHG